MSSADEVPTLIEPYPVDAEGFGGFGPVLLKTAELNATVLAASEQAASLYDLKANNRQKFYKQHGWEFEAVFSEIRRITRAVMNSGGQQTLMVPVTKYKTEAFAASCGHLWGAPLEAGSFPGPAPADVMIVTNAPTLSDFVNGRLISSGEGQFLLRYLREEGGVGMKDWYVTSLIKTVYPERDSKFKMTWWNMQKWFFLQEYALVRPRYILALGSHVLKALLGSRATMKGIQGTTKEFALDLVPDAAALHDYYHYVEARHNWQILFNRIVKSAEKVVAKDPSADLDEVVQTLCRERDLPPEPAAVLPPEVDHITSTVVACPAPRPVMADPDTHEDFRRSVRRAVQVLCHDVDINQREEGLTHLTIRNEIELLRLIKRIREENTSGIIAVDAEWNGEHPQNDNYYVRTVQFSWDFKKAAAVVLHAQGGRPAFQRVATDSEGKRYLTTEGGIARAVELMNQLLRGKRLVGHYLGSDIEMLEPLGLDVLTGYTPADNWEDVCEQGGLDTAFLAHALSETDEFNLNYQYLKHTQAPRYDLELEAWKTDYCAKHGLKSEQLEGYGECCDQILIPYSLFDADVTYRIAMELLPQLRSDRMGNDVRRAYWLTHQGYMGAIEMTRVGLLVDKQRLDDLSLMFLSKAEQLKAKLKAWARWPELNPNSVFQLRELLFGVRHNGKFDEQGRNIRLRPPQARSLNAVPMLTTGQRQKFWTQLEAAGELEGKAPATGGNSLGILYHEGENILVERDGLRTYRNYKQVIGFVRDYKSMVQALRVALRAPVGDPDEGYETTEEDGLIYDEGVPAKICQDGRLRGRFYPTKETGRWSIASPNLQNWTKRKEEEYTRILGAKYQKPIRSMIIAPEGHVMVEADYTGAELLGMAIYSGDQNMIEHCLRNQLPEDDPRHYDIHSNVAVRAFRLDCEPSKRGLKEAKKSHLRIAAKAVIFGYAYGQQANAVVVGCRAEGTNITYEEALALQEALESEYPMLVPFFQQCRDVVSIHQRDPGRDPRLFMRGMFGRCRRFRRTDDRRTLGDYERQCMNFPLQNMVADAVNLAIYHLRKLRQAHFEETGEWLFDLILQVHDALTFLVPCDRIDRAVDLIRRAMVDMVELRRCNLLGEPVSDKVYHFGSDIEVFREWSVPLTEDDCRQLGIDAKYAG